MALTPGYKHTEVGIIPEDWDAPNLGAILRSMQLGGNYKNSERETSWPLIKMGNLGRGSIKLDKVEFIDSSQPPASKDRLKKGDILFNTRNTLDLVGKVVIWRNELPEAYFNSNLMRMEFDESQVASKFFMNYILNTPRSLKALREIAIGTTSVAAIYSRDLVKLKVPLPTKAEQEAMAKALSDADALIESLEQLIAKKRHLKHGAMQELLTGKKRLPGFVVKEDYKQTEVGVIPEDWRTMRLQSLLSQPATYGVVKAGIFQGRGIPMLRGGDIKGGRVNTDLPLISREKSAEYQRTVLRHGDVVIALVGYPGEAAVIPEALGGANISRAVGLLRPSNALNAGFLTCYLNSSSGRKEFLKPGAGSAQMVVNLRDLNLLWVPLPPTKSEQGAIAEALSDVDAEIGGLEAKLAKARQVKQGMMQELLTGRIWLV